MADSTRNRGYDGAPAPVGNPLEPAVATAELRACPLDLADCDMWADDGRIDMHYRPGESPQSCFICGDPLDHYGHAHGVATGDGRTRAATVVPLDDGWPKHCGQPMWFRGGEQPKFYCDCGHERPPLPTEFRNAT